MMANHEEFGYPKQINLMKSPIRIGYHKVKWILWFYGPNKVLCWERHTHSFLLLLYPFTDAGVQKNLLEHDAQNVISSNKIKFELYDN